MVEADDPLLLGTKVSQLFTLVQLVLVLRFLLPALTQKRSYAAPMSIARYRVLNKVAL